MADVGGAQEEHQRCYGGKDYHSKRVHDLLLVGASYRYLEVLTKITVTTV